MNHVINCFAKSQIPEHMPGKNMIFRLNQNHCLLQDSAVKIFRQIDHQQNIHNMVLRSQIFEFEKMFIFLKISSLKNYKAIYSRYFKHNFFLAK